MAMSISIGAPLGYLEGGSSTRDFERWMKEALGMERFSLKRLSAEGLWGGLLYWGPWKICLERLQIRESLSIVAPLCPRGNWNQEGGALILGTLNDEEGYRNGVSHSDRTP
jgi:hypothetical protein